jgi:hypothetical protein
VGGRSSCIGRGGSDTPPWEIEGSGRFFRVRRVRHGNAAEYEYAKDTASRPLELIEEDAVALSAMLNGLLREARDLAGARRSARSQRSA